MDIYLIEEREQLQDTNFKRYPFTLCSSLVVPIGQFVSTELFRWLEINVHYAPLWICTADAANVGNKATCVLPVYVDGWICQHSDMLYKGRWSQHTHVYIP